MTDATQTSAQPRAFASLGHPGYRFFLIGMGLAMMADAIEHVISYWLIFEKFHSPELGGFAIIAHWVPFLLFSFFAGSLADRFDPRRIIQLGLALFMTASLGWGYFALTDTLQQWHAVILLIVHGFAGIFWAIPAQLLIHEIVGPKELPSAVRLMAMSRVIGLLLGPAVGGGLMVVVGPINGIFINVLIYMPLMLWLVKAPYGPKFRTSPVEHAPARARGFADVLETIRGIAGDRTIIAMILLAGAASFFVGNGYQPQMPEFSTDLGVGDSGVFYSLLFAANAAGALTAGIALESLKFLRVRPASAFLLVVLWCCAMAAFAAAPYYWLAIVILVFAGFFELSFSTMAQTIVQLNAPAATRGRVIGLFNMAFNGLKAFSGFTIGVGGGIIGIHWSLGLSALLLCVATGGLAFFTMRPRVAVAAE